MPKKITYIGSGSAALFGAIMSAKAGDDVTIIEMAEGIGLSTSNATACRINLGLHYNNEATIKKVQEESIQFVRTLLELLGDIKGTHDQGFLLKELEQFYLPTGCDYLLDSESKTTPENLKALADCVADTYREFCKNDPKNRVFGDPENLVTPLQNHFLKKLSTQKHQYTAGYHVREHFLNWPKIVEKILQPLLIKYHVQVKLNQKVLSIQRPLDEKGYLLRIDSKEMKEVYSPIVVNSTCQEIAALNQTAGHPYIKGLEERTLRPKVRVEIENVPSEIKHSRVVIHGKYAAITIAGEGKAYLTAEEVTTLPESNDLKVGPKYDNWIKTKDLNSDAKKELEQIGAAALCVGQGYFSELKSDFVKVVGERPGIVMTREPIDSRTLSGVERTFLGLHSNHAMKLTSGPANGMLVNKMAAEDDAHLKVLAARINSFHFPPDLKQGIMRNMLWLSSVNYSEPNKNLLEQHKNRLNQRIQKGMTSEMEMKQQNEEKIESDIRQKMSETMHRKSAMHAELTQNMHKTHLKTHPVLKFGSPIVSNKNMMSILALVKEPERLNLNNPL